MVPRETASGWVDGWWVTLYKVCCPLLDAHVLTVFPDTHFSVGPIL